MNVSKKLLIVMVAVTCLSTAAFAGGSKEAATKAREVDLSRQPEVAVPSNTEYWQISAGAYAEVAAKGWLFGMATRSLYNDYFLAMQKAVVDRCYEWGIEVVTADAMLDPQLQLDQMDRFISMGVDAVILNAQDPVAILPAVRKLNRAGIKVVTLDIELPKEKVDLHISFDNYVGGENCGNAVVELLRKRYGGEAKGTVLEIMGDPRHIVTSQRSDGFNSVVNKHPGIRVIQRTGNWLDEEAYNITQTILTAEGRNIDAIYMHSDCMLSGTLGAIRALGHEVSQDHANRIYVLALDGFPVALKAMRENRLDFVSIQPVNYYGYLAVDFAIRLLQGEKIPTSGTLDIPGEDVWSPARFVKSEYEVGPQLLTTSRLIGTDVQHDDPRLWGNWLPK